MKLNHKQKGFTLIELIVVIAIIGILAAVALPKLTSLKGDATEAAAKGLFAALQTAVEVNSAAGKTAASCLDLLTAGSTVPDGVTLTDASDTCNVKVGTVDYGTTAAYK